MLAMNKAGRMQSVSKANVSLAYLTKTITYNKDGQEIVVNAGKQIHIDTDRCIALIDGDHVDVSDDEYQIYCLQ